MNITIYLSLIVMSVICAFVGGRVNSSKGRSYSEGFAIGFLLGAVGLIIVAVLPQNERALEEAKLNDGTGKRCPYCAEIIKQEAVICPHCRKELSVNKYTETNPVYNNRLSLKELPVNKYSSNKPVYNNRLGLRGWVYAGNYTFERYLYIGHRLSGLGLISYMVLHIIETANRMRGEEAWAALMGLFASPVFKVVEYLLFAAAVFHAMNGVRLLLVELGFFLGKPQEPIFPYKSSVMKHRPLTYIIMLLAGLLMALGGSSLFFE